MDRVRNEEVRRTTNVTTEVTRRVDMQMLRWFGHMERMDDGHMTKRVMKAGVNGRGARGRPRYRWMDVVKRALRDRGLTVEEASERAKVKMENGCEGGVRWLRPAS